MPVSNRPLAVIVVLALMACGLSGCAGINEKLAAELTDIVPQWAGGLPPDAPPRLGTAKYNELMQERERKRLESAPPADATVQPSPAALEAIH
jgi:hypothetical protein